MVVSARSAVLCYLRVRFPFPHSILFVAEGLSKEKFLELLNKDKAAKAKQSGEASGEDADEDKKPKWGVLSDNYMLDASFKKWKNAAESEDEDEEEEEREFESDEMEEEEEEELEMESD